MSSEILLISNEEVKHLLSMARAFDKYRGDIRVMPSHLESLDSAGVKVVNVYPNNPVKYRMPTVMTIACAIVS